MSIVKSSLQIKLKQMELNFMSLWNSLCTKGFCRDVHKCSAMFGQMFINVQPCSVWIILSFF